MGELFECVCAEATLFDAWRRVKHKGARGGIDQVTITVFRQRLNDNLAQLRTDLFNGRYVPEPFQKLGLDHGVGHPCAFGSTPRHAVAD